EEAVWKVRMPSLGLGHHVCVVLPRDAPQRFCLLARDVDRAFPSERDMVEIQYLVVECLQRPLGDRDQPDWQIEARQPGGCLRQVLQVIQVDLNVGTLADVANGWDEPDSRVWLDHSVSPICPL